MRLSLHPFARSRCLRAMGMLAWLMLVVTSTLAMPVASPQSAQTAAATVSMAVHCDQDSSSKTAAEHYGDQGCCGGALGLACHCAAMCGSALAPVSLDMAGAIGLTVAYVATAPRDAPSPVAAPLLRPPLA